MEKSESIKELATALNKAQATLQVAKKGSENPFFHSKYADLLSIWDACREALTTNGLSITQIADTGAEGKAVLETVLMHTSGEWIKGRLPLLPVKADPQAQGSAITYARRYSLSAIIGLCTEEDDDAEGAMNREAPKKDATEAKGHWCSIHKTPFFKTTKMKGYAHPIKDENGNDTGEWCNEIKAPEPKLKPEPKTSPDKTSAPIDLASLKFKNPGEFYTACKEHLNLLKSRVDAELPEYDLSKADQREMAWQQIVAIYGHKVDKESQED
jgi:hypothetical protein